jgi:hypothetical protein
MRRLTASVSVGLIAALACIGSVGASAGERGRPDERGCSQHGPGFVQVPGTATCVRIGGRVASEYGGSTRRDAHGSGFGTSGRVSVDTRTDTAYGPLRTYVRVRAGSSPER